MPPEAVEKILALSQANPMCGSARLIDYLNLLVRGVIQSDDPENFDQARDGLEA